MKTTNITLCLILILLCSIFVSAAGRSTNDQPTQPEPKETSVSCDSLATMKERIRCRLEKAEESEGTPELCKVAQDASFCKGTYLKAAPCYEKSANEKAQCFRSVLAITNKAKSSNQQKRYYVALLLYELEERVEKAYDAQQITLEESTNLITQIEEIKQYSLTKSKSELSQQIQSFKQQYMEVMP